MGRHLGRREPSLLDFPGRHRGQLLLAHPQLARQRFVLDALVVVLGRGGDGQRGDLDQPPGQRRFQRFGEADEGREGVGLVGGELEELAEVAEPLDPGCEQLAQLFIERVEGDRVDEGHGPARLGPPRILVKFDIHGRFIDLCL